MLTIHCVSHRLELAIKDSLLKHGEFVSVNEIMSTIFYMMKQSGKFNHQFHATAEALGVQVYIPLRRYTPLVLSTISGTGCGCCCTTGFH